jgi:hypothetical protein
LWSNAETRRDVRGLVDHFPKARLLVMPDGGHKLAGHSAEVKAEITQFLHSTVAKAAVAQ